jgi:Cu-Zn family superoxide dismutase
MDTPWTLHEFTTPAGLTARPIAHARYCRYAAGLRGSYRAPQRCTPCVCNAAYDETGTVHPEEAMNKIVPWACGLMMLGMTTVAAKTAKVTINKIDENGIGTALGTIQLQDTKDGLRIVPNLKGLSPGPHGFHVHVNADCSPAEQGGKKAAGMAAGGHFDPNSTGKHRGPLSTEGHKGDLPVLVVDAGGRAHETMLAPHLTVDAVKGRSLMVHAGGDNFADEPAPLGGGGARFACGTVQ